MSPFGLPAPAAMAGAVKETTAANGELLAAVVNDLVSPLTAALSANGIELGAMESTMRRSLSNKVTANNKRLDQIGEALVGPVVSAVAVNGGLLNQVMMAAGQATMMIGGKSIIRRS